MNAFPLAPFLTVLSANGIRVTLHDYERIHLALRGDGSWTLARLRSVLLALLVHDKEQAATFAHCFESFFNPHLEAEAAFSHVDVDRVLEDLRTLIEYPTVNGKLEFSEGHIQRLESKSGSLGSRFGLWTTSVWAVIAELCDQGGSWLRLVGSSVSSYYWSRKIPLDESPQTDPSEVLRIPQALVLHLNPEALSHFRLGTIGGKPAPYLDAATLDQLADSLGYFQSEQPSQFLNIPASIEATGRNGGIPALLYYRRKQVRSVLVLEDAFAESLAWNPIAQELAEGLDQRGVPVLYGRFYGSPQQFHTIDGSVVQLDDLEDYRRGYLVLVFSDGKGVRQHRDTFVLEALARWPMVSWMELREPRSWDESTALPAHYRFPIYPATRDGLLHAMGRFLTERGSQEEVPTDITSWRGLPAYKGKTLYDLEALAAYLEVILGDALLWAQACAMIQPVSVGLAHALRREFHPDLPPERIERLFALPNTTPSVSGLRFTDPVLAVLRRGFAICWEEKTQENVLRFLLDKIQEAEPSQEDSLAHLAWEWVWKRVQLELEPDKALKRLVELSQTPLSSAIRAEMKKVVPQQAGPGHACIPLRVAPKGKNALQQLQELAAPEDDVFPFPVIDASICISCSNCYDSCPTYVLAGDPDTHKATVVNPIACIAQTEGCTICEDGCPTGSIRVTLGPKFREVEHVQIDEHNESNIPGLFSAGDITGSSWIKEAVNQGDDVVRYIYGDKPRLADAPYDVIIVGAGPAGLSAGLQAKRLGLCSLILERGTIADHIRSMPEGKALLGEPESLPLYGLLPMMEATNRESLIELWQQTVQTAGLEVNEWEEVTDIAKTHGLFTVTTSKGTYQGAYVILAIGKRSDPRKIGASGEDLPKVSYNLIDVDEWKGKKVLIVGCGDSAIEAAVALSKEEGTTVTLSCRRGEFSRIKPRNGQAIAEQEKAGRVTVILNSTVAGITETTVTLQVEDERRQVENDAVFVLIGRDSYKSWLEKIGVRVVHSLVPIERGVRKDGDAPKRAEQQRTPMPYFRWVYPFTRAINVLWRWAPRRSPSGDR